MNAPARIPANPVEVRLNVLGQLTFIEQQVFDICQQAANAGKAMPTNDDIALRIGSRGSGGSTVAGILGRLATKGKIKHDVYQRGRQITIVATGKQTAPPPSLAIHWRKRTDLVPAPSVPIMRQRTPTTSEQIEQEARALGKAVPDFLADLVYIGWAGYLAEKAADAA